MIRTLLVIALALTLGVATLAGEITLRPGARVAPGATISLADVADLSGADAEALADATILTLADGAKRASIEPRDVRAALDERSVNWGRLTLRGARCEIVVIQPAEEKPAPRAPAPAPIDPMQPIDPAAPSTVRTIAGATLARLFSVQLTDLKVAFDESARALLDTPAYGRRVQIQPAAAPSGSRIPLNVWIYDHDRVVSSGQIRADVLVRRTAVVASAALSRGQAISAGDVSLETMWLEPDAGSPIDTLDDAVGLVCRTRIPAGTTLRADHLERPLVVRRGDLVTVHCISGGIVVKSPARALSDGHDGEVIEFQVDKSRRPFLARVNGAGRAVMVISAEPGPTEQHR